MMISQSKESILKKIRQALSTSTPLPFPKSEGNSFVYQPLQQELELEFAQNFSRLQGKFVFCLNEAEMLTQVATLVQQNNWTGLFTEDSGLQKQFSEQVQLSFSPDTTLAHCDVAFTTCEALVARTGSIVLSAALAGGRTTSVYAPVHICIAYSHQLVYDVKDALEALKIKYLTGIPSLVTFASGPSRTADIEKTLVVGIHGPKEVYVFLIDNPESVSTSIPDTGQKTDTIKKGAVPPHQIDLFSNNNT